MANINHSERIEEIIRRRLQGEPVASISVEMGLSRTYIYNTLSRIPKMMDARQVKSISIAPSEECKIVLDYLKAHPPYRKIEKYGKVRTPEAVAQIVAEMHNLSADQVIAVLHRVTDPHPKISHFPLYSNIEKWKMDNLITMKELANSTGMTVQGINHILNGFKHMSLETARRIQKKSGLSLSEIYMDLIMLDRSQRSANYEQK